MGHTRYEPAFDDRQPWNARKMVGAKKALKPKASGRSVSISNMSAACVIVPF
jgi:hypothetical protein